ncbi:MKI67 FHA domain-interacting nucleolar phosphoprotein-like [Malaya genurostris]|uniref:MKI67 FHA domain-interacting nucleolar phosphoprotein-like n=1 Tax=Malaya genurostris TaxID=325434 RepID=UPI0026F38C80|nr:MKI67 FHA domain-interacting nucleolar phosphoprotein-like [Malaya genurostris]
MSATTKSPKTKSKNKPLILSNKKNISSKQSKTRNEQNDKGIIYVKHLPNGFYEKQLKTFFSQFGDVTQVYVARSKKTLRSRGYAYVEFLYREVAQIAAETMNNYLMFGKILKTGILPAGAKKFPQTYKKVVDSNGKETTTYKLHLKRLVSRSNGRVTPARIANRNSRSRSKLNNLKQKYAELGIEYDVDSIMQKSE